MSSVVAQGLTLIIPWCDRDALGEALRSNLPTLKTAQCRIIIVNCGGDHEALRRLIPPSLTRTTIVGIRTSFNKSLSINVGLSITDTPLVSVLDADIIVSYDYLKEMLNALGNPGFYSTAAYVEETVGPIFSVTGSVLSGVRRENYLHLDFGDGRKVTLRSYNLDVLTGVRAGPGLLSAHTSDLKAIGGYHSGLDHWGWEDLDIQIRLMYLLRLKRIELGTVKHISHSDSIRRLGLLSKEQANAVNMTRCLEAYAHDSFKGTLESDRVIDYELFN